MEHKEMSLMEEMGNPVLDPGALRFPEDSELWLDLLSLAAARNTELMYVLIYLRGVGMRLVPDPKFKYKLVPIIDERVAWATMEQYKEEAKYLVQYKKELTDILKHVGEDHDQN